MYKPKIDFDSFLQEKFMEDNPRVLDDDIPDAFSDWLVELTCDDFIDYGQEYAELINKKLIEYSLFVEDIADNERRGES